MKKFIACFLTILLPLCSALSGSVSSVSNSGNPYASMTTFEADELKSAIMLGIVPKTMQKNYGSPATGSELLTLLKNVVSFKKGSNKIWTEYFDVKRFNSKKPIQRQYAAVMLCHAAQTGLAISQENGTPLRYNNTYIFQDEVSDKYGKMDKGFYGEIRFAFSQYDLKSDAPLMEVTSDKFGRLGSKLTRLEAIQAAYRLSNSITPKVQYVPMDKVGVMTLTSSELSDARKLPAPTLTKLPAWRGMTLENGHQYEPMIYGTKYYCENDVKLFSQLGFNFARVPLNYYVLFKSEAEQKIDMGKLKNLDDLVRWGIKYGVHICLDFHCLPGYQSATYAGGKSGIDNFFSNSKRQDIAAKVWKMLAEHYKKVPSSVLSFDLLNEPMSDPMENEEATYTGVVRKIISAVKGADATRFIFIDGIRDDIGGPSRKPVESLKDENVAQSLHFYGDVDFANNAFNYDSYSPQSWPLPFVNGQLKNDRNSLTISGNFDKNTNVAIHLNGINGFGSIRVLANGKQIAEKTILKHTIGKDGCTDIWDLQANGGNYDLTLNATLSEKAQKIEISFQGEDEMNWYWASTDSVVLTYPELSFKPVPFYGAAMKNSDITYRKNKVTNIICSSDWRMTDSCDASTIVVDSDGIYKNPGQSRLEWNIDYMRKQIENWSEFSKANGIAVMCQEFGVNNRLNSKVGLAFLDDLLTVLDENNIPWCMWGYWEGWGIFNDNQVDAKQVKYGPYYLNKDKLDVLQKHMKK